jgi:hypothetical protein
MVGFPKLQATYLIAGSRYAGGTVCLVHDSTIFRELCTKYMHPPTKHAAWVTYRVLRSQCSSPNPPLAIRPVLREWSEWSGSWVRITVKMGGGGVKLEKFAWVGLDA